MQQSMQTVDWSALTLQPNTRCRIGTPTLPPTNALITRVTHQRGAIWIFGKPYERGATERPLAQIDTGQSEGQIQKTAADGIVLKWFHPKQGRGTLLTFPRRNGQT
ncbi:MAG: hypothetical protein UX89_C0009G0009 [Parcubacteria group bacterium GW2011_GWA2_47_16]|nr:MAG: hypothetical protein UX89_C0009G0009 [Parcubacteria group bacterium GW2011_GWA2_47_16]